MSDGAPQVRIPHLVGQAEGRNVLDAFRAAGQLEEFTLRNDTVIRGHSQGGHGALFSAAIAKDYAPEISILGVAAFAPATNLVDLAVGGLKDGAAGKVVSSYIAGSWNELFPELDVASLHAPGGRRSALDRGPDPVGRRPAGRQGPCQYLPVTPRFSCCRSAGGRQRHSGW